MAIDQWSDEVRVARLGDDPQLADDLEQLLRQAKERPSHAVLDFSQVSFLSSSNIADLLRLRQEMDKHNSRLLLAAVPAAVWSTVKVTGVDKLFDTQPNLPIALAAVQLDEDDD